MARVFVAMSGGVDSSVAAALLLEQGHDVVGVTMQLWPSGSDEGGCCSVSAIRDAKRVCDRLGIAHYTLNFRRAFATEVIEPFADSYAEGLTPNPCVACNDRLKFSDLLARVSAQGAQYLATGHYARIVFDDGEPHLTRAVDPAKDQSYFLYRLTTEQMRHVMFPVGELHKADVRLFAERLGLSVATKPDSQEICFATDGDYTRVIGAHRPDALVPGDIVDEQGRLLGRHDGIAHFTVGQRKGLGIDDAPGPWYVIRIDAHANRVTVGERARLRVRSVTARDVVWHGQRAQRVDAVVRYRMEARPASAIYDGRRLTVDFDEALEGVAPGQSVVCYDGDRVVGGGMIECAD